MKRTNGEHEVAVLVLRHPLVDPAASNSTGPVLRIRCHGDLPNSSSSLSGSSAGGRRGHRHRRRSRGTVRLIDRGPEHRQRRTRQGSAPGRPGGRGRRRTAGWTTDPVLSRLGGAAEMRDAGKGLAAVGKPPPRPGPGQHLGCRPDTGGRAALGRREQASSDRFHRPPEHAVRALGREGAHRLGGTWPGNGPEGLVVALGRLPDGPGARTELSLRSECGGRIRQTADWPGPARRP